MTLPYSLFHSFIGGCLGAVMVCLLCELIKRPWWKQRWIDARDIMKQGKLISALCLIGLVHVVRVYHLPFASGTGHTLTFRVWGIYTLGSLRSNFYWLFKDACLRQGQDAKTEVILVEVAGCGLVYHSANPGKYGRWWCVDKR